MFSCISEFFIELRMVTKLAIIIRQFQFTMEPNFPWGGGSYTVVFINIQTLFSSLF